MAYRTWLNLLLIAAALLAFAVMLGRHDDAPGIVIEPREPPLSSTIEAAR